MNYLMTLLLLLVVLSTGCAVAPTNPGEPASVTEDISHFLKREWPLKGRPKIPPDAMPSSMCACGNHGSCDSMESREVSADSNYYGDECYQSDGCFTGEYPSERVWANDWDAPPEVQEPKVIKLSRPPAIPNDSAPPGRFFPVPVQPVFAPNSADQQM